MPKYIILCCALFQITFSAMPVLAADINVIPASGNLPPIITVSGNFKTNDERAFVNIALSLSNAIVVFQSNGGSLLPGIEIGKAIRLKGFSTVVLDESYCASACALAWLGGVKRYMSSNAKIGFHAAYTDEGGFKTPTSVRNALVGAYVTHLGL